MINRSDERKQTMYGASRAESTAASDDPLEDSDDNIKAEEMDEEDDGETEGASDLMASTRAKRPNEMDRSDTPNKVMASEHERPGKAHPKKGMIGADTSMPKGPNLSDADEMKGPAHKVEHGRGKPAGHEPKASGAIIGSGSQASENHFANVGHGEREPMARHTGGHNYKD